MLIFINATVTEVNIPFEINIVLCASNSKIS